MYIPGPPQSKYSAPYLCTFPRVLIRVCMYPWVVERVRSYSGAHHLYVREIDRKPPAYFEARASSRAVVFICIEGLAR